MDSIIQSLGHIKSTITDIINEVNCLKDIHEITLEELPTYQQSLYLLDNSINMLYEIFIDDIPTRHNLDYALLRSLEIEIKKLNKLIKYCISWHDNVTKQGCICYKLKTLLLDKPSSIQKKINDGFMVIVPYIEKIQILEKNVLGSGIDIENKILRKAWSKLLDNQINDSSIEAVYLTQILFLMLKKEDYTINNNEDIKQFYLNKISKVITYIDSLAGTEPDNIITILELQQIPNDDRYNKSVKDFLNIIQLPDEEFKNNNNNNNIITDTINKITETDIDTNKNTISNLLGLFGSVLFNYNDISTNDIDINITNNKNNTSSNIDNANKNIEINLNNKINNEIEIEIENKIEYIDLSYNLPFKVTNKDIVGEKQFQGYGKNWSSKIITEIILPNNINCIKRLEITCIACDQGFGGTGHVQLRYQLNNEVPFVAFSIWRDRVPDNNYKFIIDNDNNNIFNKILQPNDIIKLWLCVPPWNAWTGTITDLKCCYIY